MKLTEALAKGTPLVVVTPMGGERYSAATFLVEGGVVYFDIGWDSSSTHALHLIEGTLPLGDEPWSLGNAVIRPLEEGDKVMSDFLAWSQYLTTREGKLYAGPQEALQELHLWCLIMGIQTIDQSEK